MVKPELHFLQAEIAASTQAQVIGKYDHERHSRVESVVEADGSR